MKLLKMLELKVPLIKYYNKHGEAKVFLHLASPFHFNVTDVEKELLLPAVDGTKNVLQAIYNFGNNIEKVVITSSLCCH